MRLNVPYVRQPRNEGWCGVAAAAMVLKYYGVKISQQQVAREAPVTNRGITSGRLGRYFLRKGFDVSIQFWLSGLEPWMRGLRGGIESLTVVKALGRGIGQRAYPDVRSKCRDMLTFVRHGGKVSFEPLFFRGLIDELCNRHPVILEIDANWFDAVERKSAGHLVVVTGFAGLSRKDRTLWPTVYAHDPAARADRNYDFDELLYACHIWYGGALFIRPRL